MTRKKKHGLGFGLAFLISLSVMVLYLGHPRFMEMIELKIFDLHFRWRKSVCASAPQIAIAAIDQKSIDEIGRWPWSRDKMSSLVKTLSEAGAKIVAFDITFPSSEKNYDRDFSLALKKAGNVILGMFFFLSPDEARQNLRSPPAFITSYPLVQQLGQVISSPVPKGYGFEASLDNLAGSALANGFFNMYPDFDGVIRWAPLIIEYRGHYYPSLDMQIIKHYHHLGNDAILIRMNEYGVDSLMLKGGSVPVDDRGHLLINYRGPQNTYPHYSICDILAHRVPAKSLRDKIILVGATATGIYDMRYTPYKIMSGVEIHANILDNLLHSDFLYLPKQHLLIELFILLALGLLLSLVLPSTHSMTGLGIITSLLVGYVAFNQYLFSSRGIWLNLVYPVTEILIIFTLISLYRYTTEEKEKKRIKNSFEHYLAPALVQELIHNPRMLRLGGEKRVLTVLFCDIRGFTSVSEQLKPETLVSFLNEYMSVMSTIILDHSGFLDKFIGDAIMAVYCAPLFRDDHANLACQTALDMREALVDINHNFQQKNLPQIKIGLGLNSGDMIVGNVGSRHRMDYTVLGDNVNLASRLEGITKVYGVDIVISESTRLLVQDRFVVRELDMVRVKGKTKPVKIYELVGRKKDDPLMKIYDEGLTAYRNQHWKQAAQIFREALKINPADGPSKYYLNLCQQYTSCPPRPDWDGVLTLTSK